MLYTIENDFLKVDINDEGAQMMSLVGKKTGFEYRWQGDATFWASRATVLFPIAFAVSVADMEASYYLEEVGK